MTQGQRPAGGTNDPSQEEGVPGTRPEKGLVGPPPPAEEPRAAQGGMSDDVTTVPDRGGDHPDGKKPGMPDATGPTG